MKHLSVVRLFAASICLVAGLVQAASSVEGVALVTAVEGKVSRITASGNEPVQSFVKLKQDERILLENGARIQIIFFASKRQESWHGAGQLEINLAEGKGRGLPEPQFKVLPDVLVKQISKTPTLDSQGRAGMVRLRSIPTPDALAKLDKDYRQLRQDAAGDDLNPELFLLAGLLEMRQVERIEQVLADVQVMHSGNMEAKVLVALYQKTLKNMRESGK
jgi:hypothetical protein